MSTGAGTGPTPVPGGTALRGVASRICAVWHRLALAGIVALALGLNLWRLDRNGWGNEYYSAAVRSMSDSWHAFVFAAFDPGGLVAVDKTPLALWVQALSVRIAGYSEAAVLMPQALMGAASVAVLYLIVSRPWGRVAGLAAALCLALTPVAVAVWRDNNPDALFLLLALLAVLAGTRAAAGGARWHAVAAGVLVGLAFLTKMLLALVVVPGLMLAVLIASPLPPRTRIGRVVLAGGAAIATAGAWVAAVALTPASSRPWVGSTDDDSILSLVLGYNGVGRVAGQTGGTSSAGGSGGAFSGEPGLFRLLNDALGDQIAWLLPLAVVAGISLVLAQRRGRGDRARAAFCWAMGGWFVAGAVILSAAGGIVHSYYAALLAPPMCGVVGAGLVTLWGDVRRGETWPLLPCAGIGITAAVQAALLDRAGWAGAIAPAMLVLVALGMIALILAARRRADVRGSRALATAGLAVAMAGLLLAPAAWSLSTGMGAVDGVFPGAGPGHVAGLTGDAGTRRAGAGGGGDTSLAAALAWAKADDPGVTFTIIVNSEQEAAPLIIAGESVAAMGGFTGRETVLAPRLLADLVASGRARYFYLGEVRSLGARGNASIDLVRSVCAPVAIGDGAGGTGDDDRGDGLADPRRGSGSVLYDCAGQEGALR